MRRLFADAQRLVELSDGYAVGGTQMVVMNAVVTAGAIFFLWFRNAMARRGVLR